MIRELGVGKCGLACCVCSKNSECGGCGNENCSGVSWCVNRKCAHELGIAGCYECGENCEKGLMQNIKPRAFTKFIKLYGVDELMNCLERNENNGVVYHREGKTGDYDDFDNIDDVIEFIKNVSKQTLKH